MTATLDLTELRPPAAWVRRYLDEGAWRSRSLVGDLAHWASVTPDATAIIAQRGGHVTRISYRGYAACVDRYAAGLRRLGAGPGRVVSLWMPNRWQVLALALATWKVGAVVAPVLPTIGACELERMLARLRPAVCVTADEFAGVPHAELLRQATSRLPSLAHQVVMGTPGKGQLDFAEQFEASTPEQVPGAAADPDRVSLVLFTSGTTGEPKAALHTLNTLSSFTASMSQALGLTGADVIFTPHALTHIAAMSLQGALTLRTGATALILERWDPVAAAKLMAAENASYMAAAPAFTEELLQAVAALGIGLPSLRLLCNVAAPPPRALVSEVPRQLGIPLRAIWGMTEASCMFTRPGDPADIAARSVGRPAKGLDVQLVAGGAGPVTDESPGRMLVRGAGVCLATIGRDSGTTDIIPDRDDGWYDTGDLAVPDGQGGYRLMGRAVDCIG
jgi:cyclohexanecarboxylate-CoA ligase